MPIYEYRCESCGHELDALQKIADDPLQDCPKCAASSLRRLISAPAFRLKGSGWYETDFKSEKEARRNLADRPSEDKSVKETASEEKGKAAKAAGEKKASDSSADDGGKASQSKEKTSKGSGDQSGTEAA